MELDRWLLIRRGRDKNPDNCPAVLNHQAIISAIKRDGRCGNQMKCFLRVGPSGFRDIDILFTTISNFGIPVHEEGCQWRDLIKENLTPSDAEDSVFTNEVDAVTDSLGNKVSLRLERGEQQMSEPLACLSQCECWRS